MNLAKHFIYLGLDNDSVLAKLSLDTAKMSKVNTVEGDGYQFCYLFRDIGNQSVLVKRRFYTAAEAVSTDSTQSGKRKARSKDMIDSNGPKKSKRKRRETQTEAVDQSVAGVSPREEDDNGAIGSSPLAVTADDTTSENPPVSNEDDLMDTDIAEEKPKPRMQLKYEGFHISGQCLCVVVEPLPTDGNESSLTTVPHEGHEPNQQPLFLPEQEIDLTDDLSPDAGGGMMTLSQRLHSISADYTTGFVDDGEDSEGEIFLGDADDARGY
ncbi:hypothetical protein M378DRAFT_158590 [Amanita muscaria Koide BX008]|uniref:Uncharacterized protein n=1 Tax=Amanita muscaria (strain Koide BX008) TaxID=946122 RepID=A0A0C2X1S8_AMAMK|nr:hypothetical protein M378DRAFT_158590 [Amanita muscaria Koide BX008]